MVKSSEVYLTRTSYPSNKKGSITILVNEYAAAELTLDLKPGCKIVLPPGSVIRIEGPANSADLGPELVIADNVSLRDRHWNEA